MRTRTKFLILATCLAPTLLHAQEDPISLMGEYLAVVAAHEAIRVQACNGIPSAWNPEYAGAEAWTIRLQSKKDQAEIKAARTVLRAESQKAAAGFLDLHRKFASKLPNREAACSYTLGYMNGLAIVVLKKLYAVELAKFGKVTPQH